MGQAQHHPHPKPAQYRLEQLSGWALLLGLSVGGVAIGVAGLLIPAPLFILAAPLMGLLCLPVLMQVFAVAPVTVDEVGLTLHPLWRPARHIAWADVLEVRPHTLLPKDDQEVGRRALHGKQKYAQADGVLVVVRGLPWPYRALGYFAGCGWRPTLTLSNRTHAHYARLLKYVQANIR